MLRETFLTNSHALRIAGERLRSDINRMRGIFLSQNLIGLKAMIDDIAGHNYSAYVHDDMVKDFVWRAELYPAEAVVFAKYEPALKAAHLLDLGVGGGRTTVHLLPLCRGYRGIDYSAPMIAACKERFPQASDMFAVGDARDLSEYGDAEFDFILFSFNGLDYIGQEDRLRALAEIRRTLRPDGLFFFSTHSLHAYPFPDPVVHARNMHVDPDHIAAHGWCHLIDKAPDVVTYYIRPEAQCRQLADTGFQPLEVLDMKNQAFDFTSPPNDWMIHFLSRAV